ncbi:MAG TPA: TetR family transcriptional regulator, partial [Gammaproteobacteria bacterium]|nr:TetR family transcriptional regulator [Gammaproteobacteria bacterium]
AETLFAEQGIANTSLRHITQSAQVNLASVNYHFGSKSALVSHVFVRRLQPMNDERLRRLNVLLSAEAKTPELSAVVDAFVAPPIELSRDAHGAVFIKLLGRTYTEPAESIHNLIRATHQSVIEAFKPVFQACLPRLPQEVVSWRLHFMVGVLAYAMSGADTMRLISSGMVNERASVKDIVSRLTEFIVAGLRAPYTRSEAAIDTPHVRL